MFIKGLSQVTSTPSKDPEADLFVDGKDLIGYG